MISALALIILSPFFIVAALLVKLSSKGPVFFTQERVGKKGMIFKLYKFRTMCVDAVQMRSLTVGEKDERITKIGYFLRRYKLDELPQLLNVLKNEMSIVGPRPELKKFTDLYDDDQRIVLSVKPGITDYASIVYRNESRLLEMQSNPEDYYIRELVPIKIELNKSYIHNKKIKTYFYILLSTLVSVFKKET